ncbi:neutral protease-like isoform X2 [Physella acuta]|uniref:neutral protease-like isoform X2 n=1 Tax=Physella acuta TaxID=109671 RepID=UPI0027DAEE59|nr:neutral protease-like isoform X2 [Physella acuta]
MVWRLSVVTALVLVLLHPADGATLVPFKDYLSLPTQQNVVPAYGQRLPDQVPGPTLTLENVLGLTDADSKLQPEESFVSTLGKTKTKYRQRFQGIKIYDAVVTVEQDLFKITILAANVFNGLADDLGYSMACDLDRDEAIEITLKHFNLQGGEVGTTLFEELIYIDVTSSRARRVLSVAILVTTDSGTFRPVAFIDKCSRDVVDAFDKGAYQLPTGEVGAEKTCDFKGKGGNPRRELDFGSPPFCLYPLKRSSNRKICFLENEFVKGADLKTSKKTRNPQVVNFTCSRGYNDAVNGGLSPVLDVFFYGTKTAKLYRDWYNYPSLRDPIPFMVAHFGQNFSNAVWDGKNVLFGDGDGVSLYPLTGVNTVAHEYAHGVTEKTSNLEYKGQPGAINEAFSDMAGEALEEYIFGQVDWIAAREVYIKDQDDFRYFDDPSKDGASIGHVKDYTDSLDLHLSSGIYNRVFWLIAQQLGIRSTFECFLLANRLYWRERSDFELGACGALRAAYDSGLDLDIVAESFRNVGLELKECDDLSKLVTAELRPGQVSRNLTVTQLKNPLFRVSVPYGVGRIRLKSSANVQISVCQTYQRCQYPLAVGQRSLTASVQPGDLFVRLSPRLADVTLTNVDLTVTFGFS